ncbi:MAG TPA: hypothetical protein VIN10_12470 [Bacteroidales bacterium]
MKNFISFLFAVAFLLTSCHSSKNLNSTSEKVILFGNGGGFTGQVIEYILDENGTFMKNDKLKSELTIMSTLKKSEIRKLFKELESIQFDTINFKHPGNTYYFIRSNTDNTSHEVVWGEPDNLPPTGVIQLYDLLISKTK